MVRSPRERFQDNPADTTGHAELCARAQFLRAVDAALLQYIKDLPTAMDAHGSMANSWKIEGAQGAMRMLLTIADKSAPAKAGATSNLPGMVRGD